MSHRRRVVEPARVDPIQEARSQAAITVAILAYGVGGALVVARVLLLAVGVDRSYRAGELVLGPTDLVFSPLSRLPAAATELVGNVTLLDLTALVGVLLVPVALLAFAGRR